MRGGLRLLGFALFLAGRLQAVAETDPAEVETVLFLLGDAGAPDPVGEPALQALEREIARNPERSVVVFLGDNVYPRGVPEAGSPDRAEAERRLLAQIKAASSASRTIFVPGNHDWEEAGRGGWEAIRREEALATGQGSPRLAFMPHGGCPGPEILDIGVSLRLVALDTQWWLHRGPKPRPPESGCAADTEEAVSRSLEAALAGAGGRLVAVVAHHPLLSGGEHGGSFTWTDHLFPLRGLAGWLWLPLPILGSAYPIARQRGISSQDLSAPGYAHMVKALRESLALRPPLLYASGHEHNLQVFDGKRGGGPSYLLVSGAGIFGGTSPVARLKETLDASAGAGFQRVEVMSGGRVRLTVFTVSRDGLARARFLKWLD
jgi:hypothetical protein